MYLKNILILVSIILAVNFISNQFYTSFDLTEDKRYTISQPVTNLLNSVENKINIRVFMTADFLPADFKLFKKSIIEKLDNFKSISNKISYEFEDPNKGEPELIKQRAMALTRMGIKPLFVGKNQQGDEVFIFPAALFEGKDTVVVNLIDNNIPGANESEVLNNSISLLEFNLAKGIQMSTNKMGGIIAFSEGHGELQAGQVSDLDRNLRQQGYAVGRLPFDKIEVIDPNIDVLIIAKPRTNFSDRDKFLIDQYMMNGGKVMWLIDRLTASLDSMVIQNRYTPYDYPLNIEDQLFKYGIRIQPNLIMDMECTKVKLAAGGIGNAAQMDNYPWYFHPLVRPFSDHPIVKNLDRVSLRFASVIDTIVTKKSNINKTILLKSSDHSMLKYSPVDLNFEILRIDPDPVYFNKGNLPVAVLSEGEFISAFEYNPPKEILPILEKKGVPFKTKSIPTKMIVIGDGDIIRNDYNPENGNIRSLGFDKVSRYTYANKEFLLNAIEFLVDDSGIINAKNREVKLNLLDCVKAKKEKTSWQLFNIGLPLLFLFLFGIVFTFVRKRRFGISN